MADLHADLVAVLGRWSCPGCFSEDHHCGSRECLLRDEIRDKLAAHTPPSETQPIHDDDCESRGCTHCEVCGVGVLYGSRCSAHPMLGSSGAVDHPAPPSETATCWHAEPEGECASCAACAACEGQCGTCPYSPPVPQPALLADRDAGLSEEVRRDS